MASSIAITLLAGVQFYELGSIRGSVARGKGLKTTTLIEPDASTTLIGAAQCPTYPREYCDQDSSVRKLCPKSCGLCGTQSEGGEGSQRRAEKPQSAVGISAEEVLQRTCINRLPDDECVSKKASGFCRMAKEAFRSCRRTCDLCSSQAARDDLDERGIPSSLVCPVGMCAGMGGSCASCALGSEHALDQMLTCKCPSGDVRVHCVETLLAKKDGHLHFNSCSLDPAQRRAATKLCGIFNGDEGGRNDEGHRTIEWSDERIAIEWGDAAKAKGVQEFARIPKISARDVPISTFRKEYFDVGRPVVVRDLDAWQLDWTAKYLKEKYEAFRRPEAQGGVRVGGDIATGAHYDLSKGVEVPTFVKSLCDSYFTPKQAYHAEVCKMSPSYIKSQKTSGVFLKERAGMAKVVKRHIDRNCGSFWSIQIRDERGGSCGRFRATRELSRVPMPRIRPRPCGWISSPNLALCHLQSTSILERCSYFSLGGGTRRSFPTIQVAAAAVVVVVVAAAAAAVATPAASMTARER